MAASFPPQIVPVNRRTHRRQRGVALVMVLCALFLLCLVIFELAQRVQDDQFMAGRESRSLDARALAYTGLQIALHPAVSILTPALQRKVDATHRYQARLLGEGGKINLNYLLAGEDPTKLGMLKTYLGRRGLDYQECEVLVDSMLDWIEPAGKATHHLNGSTTGLDGLPVPGRPMEDLAEVRRIKGSEPLVQQTDWSQDFTLLSKGGVDLQWASEDVVASLPGVGATQARYFVQQRRGPDRLDGTEDDLVLAQIQNPDIVLPQMLGLSQAVYQAFAGSLLQTGDSTMRIVSVGQAFDTTRRLEVVARKEGLKPLILLWKEY